MHFPKVPAIINPRISSVAAAKYLAVNRAGHNEVRVRRMGSKVPYTSVRLDRQGKRFLGTAPVPGTVYGTLASESPVAIAHEDGIGIVGLDRHRPTVGDRNLGSSANR